MTSGQWVAAIHTMPSRVGAYVRSRMANQILQTISGIATVRRAPLDSMGYVEVYYSPTRQPPNRAGVSPVAIINGSH